MMNLSPPSYRSPSSSSIRKKDPQTTPRMLTFTSPSPSRIKTPYHSTSSSLPFYFQEESEKEKFESEQERESLTKELLRVQLSESRYKKEVEQMEKQLEIKKRQEEAKIREDETIRWELEEMKKSYTLLEHGKRKLENELKDLRKKYEQDLEKEKERMSSKMEGLCKRTIEKEHEVWEKEEKRPLEIQIEELRTIQFQQESNEIILQKDLVEIKKKFEKLQIELEGEKIQSKQFLEKMTGENQMEIDGWKEKIEMIEITKKKIEKENEELQKNVKMMELEIQNERERSIKQIENACKRAVEKERKEKRMEYENLVREEEKKRKIIEKELENIKYEFSHCQDQSNKLLEELTESNKFSESIQQELEMEKERINQRIEIACKRAIEKEKSLWEIDEDGRLKQLKQDLSLLQEKLVKYEENERKLEKSLKDVIDKNEFFRKEKENEQTKMENEFLLKEREKEREKRTLQGEIEMLKKKVIHHENTIKKLEKDLLENRKTLELIEKELETERSEHTIEIRRALEKERNERQKQDELFEQQELNKRMALEKDLEDIRSKLLQSQLNEKKLDKQVRDLQSQTENMEKEFELEKEMYEKVKQNLLLRLEAIQEKRDKLYFEQEEIVQEENRNQLEVQDLHIKLDQAKAREDRMLMEMMDLKKRESRFMLTPSSSHRKPVDIFLPERPKFPPSQRVVATTNNNFRRPLYPINSSSSYSSRFRKSTTSDNSISRRVANVKKLLEED